MEVSHQLSRDVCSATLIKLMRIEIDDLWAAGCLLNPGLRNLHFVPNVAERHVWKQSGLGLIRRLLAVLDFPAEAPAEEPEFPSIIPH